MTFSLDTPSTTSGTICLGENQYIHQIRVDKSDPSLYAVKLEVRPTCRSTQPVLPCSYKYEPDPESK
jgi:hypothetical protein